MPTAAPFAANGLLYVGTGSQGDANRPFMAIRPGAGGDITLKDGESSNSFIAWRHPRASGYTPSGVTQGNRVYLVHDTGIMIVLDAFTGKEIYKVRVGGGGHTFSASPVAAGGRILLLTEEGLTFVIAAGDEYPRDRAQRSRRDVAGLSGHRRRRALHQDGIEAVQDSGVALRHRSNHWLRHVSHRNRDCVPAVPDRRADAAGLGAPAGDGARLRVERRAAAVVDRACGDG